MSNSDNSDPTIESLTKSKEEIFSEHGLENTRLGEAVEQQAAEAEDELTKHREIVEAKITLAKAREAGVDDPAVEALAESVEELSEETEAAALVEHSEEAEARERIAELESLANSTSGATSASFEEKAEALRSKHGLGDEPGKYDAEALAETPDTEDAEAASLQEFRERQAQQERDSALPQEAQETISRLKNMREQARNQGHKTLVKRYSDRIEATRKEHSG